jgi:hypothetical protein
VREDDLVRIEAGGRVEALGPAAALRLQAREGLFHVLPAPHHLVVMREAREDGDGRTCRLSGDLTAPGNIVDILGLLAQTGWRGELIVFDDQGVRSIYTAEGSVVGATSTVPSERLGQVMYRYGVLSEAQVDACVATASSSLRIGEAAVKQGFVQRERLFELMGHQIEEIVFGALLVERGVFYFLDAFDEAALSSRQLFPLSSLVRDGVRRMHETRYFRARIPSSAHIPVVIAGPPPAALDVSAVYAAIDGKRSVADLCRRLGASEFVVSRALFQLIHHGFVTIEAPLLEPLDAVAVCNEAVAVILRELDAMDEGDQVRAQLAAFAHRGVFPKLFAGMTPADDGSFDARRVVENLATFDAAPGSTERLISWLFEYAAYALFLSRPYVSRAQQSRPDRVQPGEPTARLSQRVAALLEPIERLRTKKGLSAGHG